MSTTSPNIFALFSALLSFCAATIQPSNTNRIAMFWKFQTHFMICSHSCIYGRSWTQVRGNIFTETPGKNAIARSDAVRQYAKVKPEQSIFPSMKKVLNQLRAGLFRRKFTHDHVSSKHQHIAPAGDFGMRMLRGARGSLLLHFHLMLSRCNFAHIFDSKINEKWNSIAS